MQRISFLKTHFLFLIVLFILALSQAACLADLRPTPFDKRSTASQAGKARQILLASANKMHVSGKGYDLWHKQKGAGVVLSDTWYGVMGKIFNPHPESPQMIDFRFVPGTNNSILSYLKPNLEATGNQQGIHEWNTWTRKGKNEKVVYKDDKDQRFNLPTMQYFLEMSFRLPQGDAIRDYGGLQEFKGRKHHVIYITWLSYPANSKVDQYIAWIDAETMLLSHVEFTVRDIAGFITSVTMYREYREVNGFMLPHLIRNGTSEEDETGTHEYKVRGYLPDLKWQRSDYAPEADRPASSKY